MFAMIDGDLHGPMIFQTLVEETKARAARSIEVVNLGLFPWEALADGLPHETGLREIAQRKSRTGHVRRAQVADYIRAARPAKQTERKSQQRAHTGKIGFKTTASNSTR